MTVNLDKGQLVTVQSFPTGYPGKKKMNLDCKQLQWLLYLLYHAQMPCSESETMIPKWFCTWSKKTILQDFEIFACTTLSHLPWTDHWQAVE